MTETTSHDMKELHRHLKDIRYTMFATQAGDRMRSRPMTAIETREQGGTLIFLANDGSELLDDIGREPAVNLSYSDNDAAKYVSVSGTALSRIDQALVKEVWNPVLNAWWDGPDDPAIRVVEVRIQEAEYWASPGNRIVRFVGIVAAAATGDEYDAGEHGRVEVTPDSD